MKKIFFILTCTLVSSGFIFSAECKVNEAKDTLISSHVEYVKMSIDQKCQKLNKKIKRLQKQLEYLENNGSDEADRQERREKIMHQIQKCEEQIDALKLSEMSIEKIDTSVLK